jgi:hypothetical protein
MPRRRTPGTVARLIEYDEAIYSAITHLAHQNGRSIKAEVQHALLRHLAHPPVIRQQAEVPPLPPTESGTTSSS